jgi:tRNA(Ile)-lysidine synthase
VILRRPTPPSDRLRRHLPHGGRALEGEALSIDRPIVWDGRYEIAAAEPGLIVRPLQGLAARLPPRNARR